MTVSFTEWQKINLRVGTVLSVEDHPNADKLYVLTIDLGSEQRTIVAGIRQHYLKEHLVGKQVVVVANLEPAVLRGVKSEGMILAAVDEVGKNLALISPEVDITDGAVVR